MEGEPGGQPRGPQLNIRVFRGSVGPPLQYINSVVKIMDAIDYDPGIISLNGS